MLKAKINGKEREIIVEANGNLPELCADLTTLLSVMYDGIDKDQKEMFVGCVKHIAEDELFTKSSEEIAKLNENAEEKNKELRKELKEFKSLFEDMPEELKKMIKDVLK